MWSGMAIRWDRANAKAKHREDGVRFAEAGTIMRDAGLLDGLDLEHRAWRIRFIGLSDRGPLLFV